MSVNILNLDQVGDQVGQEQINKSGLYRQLVSYSSHLTRLAYKLHVSLGILNHTKLQNHVDTSTIAQLLVYFYPMKSLFSQLAVQSLILNGERSF